MFGQAIALKGFTHAFITANDICPRFSPANEALQAECRRDTHGTARTTAVFYGQSLSAATDHTTNRHRLARPRCCRQLPAIMGQLWVGRWVLSH